MNLAHIIEAFPLQVYVRRGELVIHFQPLRISSTGSPRHRQCFLSWTARPTPRGPTGKRSQYVGAGLDAQSRLPKQHTPPTVTVCQPVQTVMDTPASCTDAVKLWMGRETGWRLAVCG